MDNTPSSVSSNETLSQTPTFTFAQPSPAKAPLQGVNLHRSATQPVPSSHQPIGGSLGRAQTQRSQIAYTPSLHVAQSRNPIYKLSSSAVSSGSISSSTFAPSSLERTPSSNPAYYATYSGSPSSSSNNTFLNTPSSPHSSGSSSLGKSLTSLDVRSTPRDADSASMISPTSTERNFYFGGGLINGGPFPGVAIIGKDREGSLGGEDIWANLCVKVLPLFNGEGVKGPLEDLNDLLRRCLTDPISPTLYSDVESLLHDGMFTLNAKLMGVSDDKLVSRLVEQWSFFFGNVLPYFEGVFLPLRTDVRWRTTEEEDYWNVRTIALKSFRDCVILPMIDRLGEVFAKLFIDFDSDKNPAETASRMLQMTSILASIPNDRNPDIEHVLKKLKANWRKFMNRRDRRGFVGIQELRQPTAVPGRIFSPVP